MDDRVTEFVDHLHEHFEDPVRVIRGRYLAPMRPGYSIDDSAGVARGVRVSRRVGVVPVSQPGAARDRKGLRDAGPCHGRPGTLDRSRISRMNRRTFLTQIGAGLTVAPAAVHAFTQTRRIEPLGVQLYTVRTLLEKDFEGTLAKVAAVGFKEVEFAGYFDKAPKDVRAILDRHGLTAPSAHVDYVSVTTKMPQLIEAAQVVGHKFLVCPWIDDQMRAQPDVVETSRGGLQQGWRGDAQSRNPVRVPQPPLRVHSGEWQVRSTSCSRSATRPS